MNPLLSFWIKVQPLTNSLGGHTWKAVSQSSSVASSSGDDAVVQRTTTSSAWAFDHLNNVVTRLSSYVYRASSSWLLNPMISRMHDAPMLKPSTRALCEADQRFSTRKVGASARVNAKHLSKGGDAAASALQQSQQILQQHDLVNYQIQTPSVVRRNSKEWVREYKKERIDKINYNNVFGGMSNTSNNEIPSLPPPSDEINDYARGRSESSDNSNKHFIVPNSPTSSSTVPIAESVPSLSSIPIPSKATITTTTSTNTDGPDPTDVICGRGGKANTHAGNISFREEARKLRSWYESSSKSEKFTISSLLVDLVRERGGRFLKRDTDVPGKWAEADGNDVRKKASQALREGRVKEKKQSQQKSCQQ